MTRDDYRQSPGLTHSRFKELIAAGAQGATPGKGILMATDALRGVYGGETPWVREESQKAVLIVTDEKNCGSAANEGCSAEPYNAADYFLERAPKATRVYGLLAFENYDERCLSGGYEEYYPTEYERLIRLTGGFSEEICQDDYRAVLERISSHVSQDIRQSFDLRYVPDDGSLKVYIDGVVVQDGFELQGAKAQTC